MNPIDKADIIPNVNNVVRFHHTLLNTPLLAHKSRNAIAMNYIFCDVHR